MNEHKKTAEQITSLARKLAKADAEELLDLRNTLISLCNARNIEVTEQEKCPPSDSECDPPENPKP